MKAFIELQQLAASGMQRAELKELERMHPDQQLGVGTLPNSSRNAAATDYVTLLLSLFIMQINKLGAGTKDLAAIIISSIKNFV
jgi:hypothetical protein